MHTHISNSLGMLFLVSMVTGAQLYASAPASKPLAGNKRTFDALLAAADEDRLRDDEIELNTTSTKAAPHTSAPQLRWATKKVCWMFPPENPEHPNQGRWLIDQYCFLEDPRNPWPGRNAFLRHLHAVNVVMRHDLSAHAKTETREQRDAHLSALITATVSAKQSNRNAAEPA